MRHVEQCGTNSGGAADLTPAEIRGVLLQLARGMIDERGARGAIKALNRIMRDASKLPPPNPVERESLR